MLVFAVALAANVPAKLQRAIPDYTSGLQDRVAGAGEVQDRLSPTGSGELSDCPEGAEELQNCGPAPDITGIAGWLNTLTAIPSTSQSLRGRVVLVDFWAYSCINCQRAIPHVVDWYGRYKDSGLTVIGVHTPEYAFERVPGNVAKGAADLGVTYPVALDNSYPTWTNYENRYWPAEYLIDANGVVRHVKFGEGGYDTTERLIRELLVDAKNAALPAPVNAPDMTPTSALTPETYLGVGKEINYARWRDVRRGARHGVRLSEEPACRLVRAARSVAPGLPGRDRSRLRFGDQAQLPGRAGLSRC